jgi:hypothetical protein
MRFQVRMNLHLQPEDRFSPVYQVDAKVHSGTFAQSFAAAQVRGSLRNSNTCMFEFRCGTSLWRHGMMQNGFCIILLW